MHAVDGIARSSCSWNSWGPKVSTRAKTLVKRDDVEQVVILLGNPANPPSADEHHVQRRLYERRVDELPTSPFREKAEGLFYDPHKSPNFFRLRQDAWSKHLAERAAYEAAAKAAGGKINLYFAFWSTEPANLPKGAFSIYGGSDFIEMLGGIATLTSCAAAIVFMKGVKDIIGAGKKSPPEITVKIGELTIGGARSVEEVQKLIEIVEKYESGKSLVEPKNSLHRDRMAQPCGGNMIDLATAAASAALLNNAVSAVDKVYNWVRALNKQAPASLGLRSDPQKAVLQYESLDGTPEPTRVVMTYAELAAKLTEDDVRHIKSFEQRMKAAMVQWEKLNASLSLYEDVERGRIEANMERLKERDICPSLREIVQFIERLGVDLQDHYASVRSIC